MNNNIWNKIGTQFNKNVTVAESLKESGADYNVETTPIAALNTKIQTMIQNGESIPAYMLQALMIDGKKATMRTDTNHTLGIVSNEYEIVQNKDAFDFVDLLTSGKISEENKPCVECAGVLHGGKRVFITVKFSEPIKIDDEGNDIIESYLVMTTTHDGTGAVRCMVTPVRVWCQNTLNIAFRNNTGHLAFKHTMNIHNKMDLLNNENAAYAYSALNLYKAYKETFEAKIQEFKNKKLDEKWVNDILAQVVLPENAYDVYKMGSQTNFLSSPDVSTRAKNIYTNMQNALFSGIGQERLKTGTALWLLNGITTYYQNEYNWKDDEKKFDQIVDGGLIQKRVQKAYELIDEIA